MKESSCFLVISKRNISPEQNKVQLEFYILFPAKFVDSVELIYLVLYWKHIISSQWWYPSGMAHNGLQKYWEEYEVGFHADDPS